MMKSVIILNQSARSMCMGKCSLSRIAGFALTFRTLNENENWRSWYNNRTNTSAQQEMRSLFPKPHRKKQNSGLTNTHMNMLGQTIESPWNPDRMRHNYQTSIMFVIHTYKHSCIHILFFLLYVLKLGRHLAFGCEHVRMYLNAFHSPHFWLPFFYVLLVVFSNIDLKCVRRIFRELTVWAHRSHFEIGQSLCERKKKRNL